MRLVQLIVSKTPLGWVLIEDGDEKGTYHSKGAAMAAASARAENIRLEGNECELLVHDEDDEWRDEACPDVPQPIP